MAQPAVVDHISELSAILKTVFGDGVEQQQNMAAMLYKRFGEATTRFGGNSYEFPARMENTQSVGARGYRQALPEPIPNTDVTARVRQKHFYGTFDITGPDIEKGKGNANAFVNTLTDKMKSLTESALKDMNMQTYLDGTGVRATVVTTSGTLITVDQVKYVRVGMHVNIIDSDGVTVNGGNGDSDSVDTAGTYTLRRYTVLDIDPTALTVELGAGTPLVAVLPTATAVGDFIVRHKTVGAELIGLAAIVDDGVNNPGAAILQDIDSVANRRWRAKVIDVGGGPLTLQIMQTAMDIPEAVSGRRIDMLVTSFNGRDQYLQLLVPQKRFTDLKLDGGFQVLEYNGRDVLVDVDCQDSNMFFLNRESIKKFGLFDLAFVEQGGGGILKHDSLAAGDVFYGFLRSLCNFGTTQRNANARVVNVPVDTNYVVYN